MIERRPTRLQVLLTGVAAWIATATSGGAHYLDSHSWTSAAWSGAAWH